MLETAPPPGIDGSVGSLGASVAVSFLSLGLVCVLAFLALRWLSRRPPGPSHGPLRVLARQSLDPKRSVFVIEAAERCFLVGAGEGAMTLLAELDREVITRELAPRRPARAPRSALGKIFASGPTFGEVLSRALGRPGPVTPAAVVPPPIAPRVATAAPAPAEPVKNPEAPVTEGGLA
jgi:flagellar biosynthetic protein FliO